MSEFPDIDWHSRSDNLIWLALLFFTSFVFKSQTIKIIFSCILSVIVHIYNIQLFSRYLEDLYTLTYHEDSSIDQDENETKELETYNGVKLSAGLTSLQVNYVSLYSIVSTVTVQVPKKTPVSKFGSGLTRSQSSGPLSLNMVASSGMFSTSSSSLVPEQRLQFASSTLDTNLHKILARRMAGGQGVSYHSCKLLTKAYYKLLRDPSSPGVVAPPLPSQPFTNGAGNNKLSWQNLVNTDAKQLSNIVAGYSALVKSLNEELVQELMVKDELVAEQDKMLETISELTDSML